MSSNKKEREYTEKDMKHAPAKCDQDRVKNGWNNVVRPTIDRLDLCAEELTMIDVGSGDGRKSLKKYAYDLDDYNHFTQPSSYGLVTSNMAAIEGNEKRY